MYDPNDSGSLPWHPNYYRESMDGYPYADPHLTRRIIRGAFTLRAMGSKGSKIDRLCELDHSEDPVPRLIGMDRQPVEYRALRVSAALKDLLNRELVTVVDDYVSPNLDLSGAMMRNPFQAMTVLMEDKVPTLEKAQEVHRIYTQGMWHG